MVKLGAWNHDLLQRRGLGFIFWAAMKGEDQGCQMSNWLFLKALMKAGLGDYNNPKLLDRSHPLKLEKGSLEHCNTIIS